MPRAKSAKQANDKYYTCERHIRMCVDFLVDEIGNKLQIIDPCAGDGRWEKHFLDYGFENIRMSDLDPDSEKVEKLDFLDQKLNLGPGVIFVTNPPFSLLPRIFNRMAEYQPEFICMLVPRSFGIKLGIRARLNSNYSLKDSLPLPRLHFENADGSSYSSKESGVTTCFQIWEKKQRKEILIPDVDNLGYMIYNQQTKDEYTDEDGKKHTKEIAVTKEMFDADFVVVTHGSLAGTIEDFIPGTQKASVRAFVKVKEGYDEEIIRKRFETTDFSYFKVGATSSQLCINRDEIVCCVEGVDYKL